MSGIEAYWHAFGWMNPAQRDKSRAVNWLVDPSDDKTIRRSGRSTVLAAALIRAACVEPGRPVSLFDHYDPGTTSVHGMEETVSSIISAAKCDGFFTFKTHNRRRALVATDAWSFVSEDHEGRPALTLKGGESVHVMGVSLESMARDIRAVAKAAVKVGMSPDEVARVAGEAARDVFVRSVMDA